MSSVISSTGIGSGLDINSIVSSLTTAKAAPETNALKGIVAAINSAPNNPGVSASILTTTAGARLVLSGTATGAANAISVTQSGGDGGLTSLVYVPNGTKNLTQTQAAQDASFSVNGYAATSPRNLVSSVI